MDIFIELGLSHLEQIVESATLTIPQILLKLMSIPEICKTSNIILLVNIEAMRTVTFWKRLFKEIGAIKVEELKNQKLQAFEPVLLALMNQIVILITPEDDVFEEFNFAGENDEVFDDMMRIREEFTRVNH